MRWDQRLRADSVKGCGVADKSSLVICAARAGTPGAPTTLAHYEHFADGVAR